MIQVFIYILINNTLNLLNFKGQEYSIQGPIS